MQKNTVVRTSDELKKAMDKKTEIIYVEGELAEKIKQTEKLKNLGGGLALTATITAIAVAIGSAPVTGGISTLAAVPIIGAVSLATGVTLTPTVIIAITFIGASLVLLIYKDYDVIVERTPEGSVRLELKLKTLRKASS